MVMLGPSMTRSLPIIEAPSASLLAVDVQLCSGFSSGVTAGTVDHAS